MKIETSESLTSTDDLKDYFSDTKDIVIINVNKTMDNLKEYGSENHDPFTSYTFPFTIEHFQKLSTFRPNSSYVADSENISCSDKSVAAKVIIDTQDCSNDVLLQSAKVDAKNMLK
ncbi:hypothetical protein CDAR_271961 [Caerostris darwini]|uniref:Uncharacterized protein n=1 Tax=Caerostris darwini TaxID=1538125 RepID=A0AAV4PL16_9ARAC|nr:hypothetical protein CDAR_280021 [Caerostris darwini]GIY78416.1 hypothetical protein CDAR_271961 [Caerostris darwini]